MGTNSFISQSEIERITMHCLSALCITDSFTNIEVEKDTILKNLRKLYISSVLEDKTVICIAGLQGAGKTTMMRNFYGLDEKYLPGTQGRGERIPVFITEKKITTPEMYAIRIEKTNDGEYIKNRIAIQTDSYKELSSGKDANVLFLELYVPYKYTFNENLSFMLLPGYERRMDEWRELVSFSVSSSDAAVFVFDESRYANVNNEECLNEISELFGKNLVYAITHTEESSDHNEALKQNVIKDLKIPEEQTDRIVCVSSYLDSIKNEPWIKELQTAVQKYAMEASSINRQRNSKFLYDAIIEVRNHLVRIRDEILSDKQAQEVFAEITGNRMLNSFDKTLEKKRKELKKQLDLECSKAYNESVDNLVKEFDNSKNKGVMTRLKRVFFGENINDKYVKTNETIKKALRINDMSKPSLPDEHLRLAMQNTLEQWDHPNEKTDTLRLMDTKKVDNKTMLCEGKNTQALVSDVKSILAVYESNSPIYKIQCDNDKRLMNSVVEMGTYYISLAIHDEYSKKIGMASYSLAKSELTVDKIIDCAKDTKRLVIGLASVIGVDAFTDGTINFIPQIAESFGVAVPVVSIASGVLVVVGVIGAISKDINRMKCADFESARCEVSKVYDKLKDSTLEVFDNSMGKLRDRIADNIDYLEGNGQNTVAKFNVLVELNNAINRLNKIAQENHNLAYNPLTLHG